MGESEVSRSLFVGEMAGSFNIGHSIAYLSWESLENVLAGVRGQKRDVYLSTLLDPGVSEACREGKMHTVIFSADWMMHHCLVLSW